MLRLLYSMEKWHVWGWKSFYSRTNLLTVVFLLFLIWSLIRSWREKLRYWKYFEKIRGPAGLPLIGNTIDLNVDHGELYQRLIGMRMLWGYRDGISKGFIGWSPYVFLSKADTVEPIMSSNRHIDKSSDYSFLHPWLGTGLLTVSGKKWYPRRKILTPAFHFNILEDFLEIFAEQTEIMVKRLSSKVDRGVFNIFPYVTLCTLDIICETAMGKPIYAQNNSESEYVRAVYKIGDIIQTRQANLWYHSDFTFRFSSLYQKHQDCIKILHDFSYKVIAERRKDIEKKRECKEINGNDQLMDGVQEKKKRLAFLDLLINASSSDDSLLTNNEIREEVDTFMFEGHDTTSSAVSWTLYLLGCHPEYQDMVVDEMKTIFDGDDADRRPTMRDLKSMKYLERCIKEGLRLYPSVPFIARTITNQVEIGKHTIPEGTTAMIIVPMLHRDPTVFPNPDKFDPDRFLPENSMGRHPYAYIPFSAGPRNCIGQKFAMLEEKVMISGILRKYKIQAAERREDVSIAAELVLRPKNGLKMTLMRRK